MSKGRSSIEQKLSAEHRQLLHERLIAKDYGSYEDLMEWVNDLDESYNISHSAIGRYAKVFLEKNETLNTLSDEERRLVLLYREMNKEKRDVLVQTLFYDSNEDSDKVAIQNLVTDSENVSINNNVN